ncbi:AraC family transcriptional regulator [Micromonospora sonneratiae]|uniref:Helix-turn-helix transcriptional regulator n=1 Tax=Micromonospora sonneratiae TaxID=1184706 RepID=A0ABW3YJW8_9ACTN
MSVRAAAPLSPPAQHQRQAIEHVVRAMRDRPGETRSLADLARLAYLSPFHFSRVFRSVTGAPPGRFLSATRMATAKRLLVDSDLSVTDICTGIGYSSLGTFTTQFGQQVGISPRLLRRLSTAHGHRTLAEFPEPDPPPDAPVPSGSVSGIVRARDGEDMLVFVGLFPGRIPLGQPAACANRLGSGPFRLVGVPRGRFQLLAYAYPRGATLRSALLGEPRTCLLVGAADRPVVVGSGPTPATVRLHLSPATMVDPPVVSGVPLLTLTRVTEVNHARA